MSLSGEALKLKDQGNAEFTKGAYKKALVLYKKACELAPDNAIVWANSAACLINLKKYAEAVEFAQRAVKADEGYAKGHGRLAAAFLGLNELDEALASYFKAISLLTKPTEQALKKQYMENIAEIETRKLRARGTGLEPTSHAAKDYKMMQVGNSSIPTLSLNGGASPWEAAKEYIQNEIWDQFTKGSAEGWKSSAWTILAANDLWAGGIAHMDKFEDLGDAVIIDTNVISDLSEALLMDQRVFRIDDRSLFRNIGRQMSLEADAHKAWSKPGDSLEDIKKEVTARVKVKGWGHVREAINFTVRILHLNAVLCKINGSEGLEARRKLLKTATDLIAWVYTRYKDVPLETRGRIFQPAIERALLCDYGAALTDSYKSISPTPETLEEIRIVGERIIKSCESHPLPEPPSEIDPVHKSEWARYYPWQKQAKADGYALQGFSYFRMAAKAGVVNPICNDAVTNALKAAFFYKAAAAELYMDDERTGWWLYLALEALWQTKAPVSETLPVAKGVVDSYERSRAIWKRSQLGASGVMDTHYETTKIFITSAENTLKSMGKEAVAVPAGLVWNFYL